MSKHTIEEIEAAYAFRKTLIPKADRMEGNAPMWFGWAIAEAFWAGMRHARAQELDPK